MKPLILVTGGTGYIGSHTTVELIQEGFEVVIVDNLSNSGIEVLDGIESITGVRPHFENFDLCDLERLRHCFKTYPGLQAVIHFAALKAVGESVEKPLDYYHNNFESLINLLRVMGEYSVPNLVFSSSCTVYGQPDHLPVTESSPVKKASSPYGNTKAGFRRDHSGYPGGQFPFAGHISSLFQSDWSSPLGQNRRTAPGRTPQSGALPYPGSYWQT